VFRVAVDADLWFELGFRGREPPVADISRRETAPPGPD